MSIYCYYVILIDQLINTTISINPIIPCHIPSFLHLITVVFLYSINKAIFLIYYNSHMVDTSIIPPVEENQPSLYRSITTVYELSSRLKPFHTNRTERKLWYNSGIDISTLIRAPWLVFLKSIPSPV